MYAVIFRAEFNSLDQAYYKMAEKMRRLAREKYGCVEFTATTEGDREIAISYWKEQGQIAQWRQDPEHLRAQELGRLKWYKSYQIQVVEILREYGKEN